MNNYPHCINLYPPTVTIDRPHCIIKFKNGIQEGDCPFVKTGEYDKCKFWSFDDSKLDK